MKYPISDQEIRALADWFAKRKVVDHGLRDHPNEDLEIYCKEYDRVFGWFIDANALQRE